MPEDAKWRWDGDKRHRQQTMWLATEQLPRTAGHVFYDRVNKILAEHGFDDFAEKACQRFMPRRWGGQESHQESIFGCN